MRLALTGVAMHPGLTPISVARRFRERFGVVSRSQRPAVLSRTTVRPLLFGFPRFLPFFKSLPSRRLRVFDLERDGWRLRPTARSGAGLAG